MKGFRENKIYLLKSKMNSKGISGRWLLIKRQNQIKIKINLKKKIKKKKINSYEDREKHI